MKVAPFVRGALGMVLVIGVYYETGWITALCIFLMFVNSELCAFIILSLQTGCGLQCCSRINIDEWRETKSRSARGVMRRTLMMPLVNMRLKDTPGLCKHGRKRSCN